MQQASASQQMQGTRLSDLSVNLGNLLDTLDMQTEGMTYHLQQSQQQAVAAQQEYMDTSQATPTALMSLQQQQQQSEWERGEEGEGEESE